MEIANTEEIKYILIIGVLMFLFLTGVTCFFIIHYNKRNIIQLKKHQKIELEFQHNLLEASLKTAERERISIAKNMHDEIGPLMQMLNINESNILAINNNEKTETIIAQNKGIIAEVNTQIKHIIDELGNPILRDFGFYKALEEFCLQYALSNSGNIEINKPDFNIELDYEKESQLLRVCKEVINNLFKHSLPSKISIYIFNDKNILVIQLTHNGTVITDNQIQKLIYSSKGLGLKSIFSRLEILSGEIHYGSTTSGQARISITLPLSN